jgi:hypothetical protein
MADRVLTGRIPAMMTLQLAMQWLIIPELSWDLLSSMMQAQVQQFQIPSVLPEVQMLTMALQLQPEELVQLLAAEHEGLLKVLAEGVVEELVIPDPVSPEPQQKYLLMKPAQMLQWL